MGSIKKRDFHWLSIASVVGVIACGGTSGGTDSGTMGHQDATTVQPDAQTDSGTRDAGDAGRRDGGDAGVAPCTPESEGCPCGTADRCEQGLTCVEWPRRSSTSPILKTCARSCDPAAPNQGGCQAPNGLCRIFVLGNAQISVSGICVPADVQAGEICKGSRAGGRPMAGCGAPSGLCHTHLLGDDQGYCGQTCVVSTSTPTGGCTTPTPICNPAATGLVLRTQTGTTPLGVCVRDRLRQGAACQMGNVVESCDTSTRTIVLGNGHQCIGFPDLPTGEGRCVEICDLPPGGPAVRCGGGNAGLGAPECTQFSSARTDIGVCTSGCSNFPENCNGPGQSQGGLGRVCQDTWGFDQGFPVEFCVDRSGPPLAAAVLRLQNGQITPTAGDDCRPGQGSNGGYYRCPEDTVCFPTGQGGSGLCIDGCTTSSVAASSGCMTTGTATICASLTTQAPIGACAGR